MHHALQSRDFVLMVGNSDVWGVQCFCSFVSNSDYSSIDPSCPAIKVVTKYPPPIYNRLLTLFPSNRIFLMLYSSVLF